MKDAFVEVGEGVGNWKAEEDVPENYFGFCQLLVFLATAIEVKEWIEENRDEPRIKPGFVILKKPPFFVILLEFMASLILSQCLSP